MAPALSKLVTKHTVFPNLLGKSLAATGGALTLLIWLASVHRNSKNRK